MSARVLEFKRIITHYFFYLILFTCELEPPKIFWFSFLEINTWRLSLTSSFANKMRYGGIIKSLYFNSHEYSNFIEIYHKNILMLGAILCLFFNFPLFLGACLEGDLSFCLSSDLPSLVLFWLHIYFKCILSRNWIVDHSWTSRRTIIWCLIPFNIINRP